VTLGVARAGPLGPARFAASDAVAARPSVSWPRPRSTVGEREALAVLVSVDGVGPTTLGRLVDQIGSASEVLEVARRPDARRILIAASRERDEGASTAASLTVGAASLLMEAATRADEILERVRAAQLSIVSLHDPAYPSRLRSIDLPPHVLFVRGDPAALSPERAVAVVGTRHPSEAGRRIASRIATALVRTGAGVMSGLAIGIDGAAHAAVVAELEGTVAHEGEPADVEEGDPTGTTVAVLGGGHERLFPRGHRALAQRIVDTGGAIVSEFAPDTVPTRGTFPRRNRIISGLAEATVVVEARVRSGALITAAWALQQGRGCFLVPGRVDDATSSGCLAFLREASPEARVVASVGTLLEDLGLASSVGGPEGGPGAPGRRLGPLVELGETAQLVGENLVRGLATADELVAGSGLPVATVLAALTMLESRGLVVGAYGRYRPAGRLAGVEPVRPELR